MEKKEFSHAINWFDHCGKQCEVSSKLKYMYPRMHARMHNPIISFSGIYERKQNHYPNKLSVYHVHCNILNRQDMQITYGYIVRYVGKEKITYVHSAIVIHKKELLLCAANMDEH